MRTAFRVILLVLLEELAVGRNVCKEDSNRRLVWKRVCPLLEKLLQLGQRLVALLVRRALRLLRLCKRIMLVVDGRRVISRLAREIHQRMINAISNASELLQVALAQQSQLSIGQIETEDPRFLLLVQ